MAAWEIIGDHADPTKYSSSTGVRWFKATLMDASITDQTLEFEFKAPFPVDPDIDYQQWAIHAFLHSITTGLIKIRDIQPVEDYKVLDQ
tara:strand:+ start:281 stop:547 length:267 start_codon:yes stop_codon:yes gene_type:complete